MTYYSRLKAAITMKNINQLDNEYLAIKESKERSLFLMDHKDDLLAIDESIDKKHFHIKSRLLTALSFEYSSMGRFSEASDLFKTLVEFYEHEYGVWWGVRQNSFFLILTNFQYKKAFPFPS